MLADNFIFSLSNVELDRKNYLPDCSGIYYVIDLDKTIWYIGRSVNINRRWNGEKSHHRYEQLLSLALEQKTTFFIYYRRVNVKQINKEEQLSIAKYQPLLNNTPIDKTLVRSNQKNNLLFKSSLTILSNFTTSQDNCFFIEDKIDMQTENVLDPEVILKQQAQQVKVFKRKFISLKDESINLNFELEICIDRQSRRFVRHHNFSRIQYSELQIIENQNIEIINNYISKINNKLLNLINPLKWLGYKLNCENILIIDEEDDFEIETLAIMLPLRMFINLLEDVWIKSSKLSDILQNQENDWFKQQDLFTKIAKYLYDSNLTLLDLVNKLDINSPTNETN